MPIQFSAPVGIKGANREVDIVRLQYLLKLAAEKSGNTQMNPGRIDGLLTADPANSATVRALKAYERSIGDVADGLVRPGDSVVASLLKLDTGSAAVGANEMFLYFNGKKLTLRQAAAYSDYHTFNPLDDERPTRYASGRPVTATWPAVSGLMANHPRIQELIDDGRKGLDPETDYTQSKYQHARDVGPIPSGYYYLEKRPNMKFDKSGGGWGAGAWWIRHYKWQQRVDARFGYIRGQFFLHEDGLDPAKMNGTSGCIGLVPGNIQEVRLRLIDYFRQTGESSIVIRVNH